MNARFFSQPLWIVALLWAFPAAASASTIEQDYGNIGVDFLSDASVNTDIPEFDPVLGSLSAIDLSYSASAVLIEGDALSSYIGILDGETLLGRIFFPSMVGREEQSESGSFSIPAADWSDFETAETTELTFTPFTACRGSADTPSGCSEFTGILSGAVTYTYTPAPAAPEPKSLVLFFAGLIVIGACRLSLLPHAKACCRR